ncbi:poly(U)-specific endoribonuclease-C-like [Alligator sinensis]|uniref:Uridylate-specific endoribonuclease n=1 Tax=Alligator sinensis TaxID=38654 RepID=A0A3Q0FS16_ALLSI|nr:poly(U)-specific endoribonuclease-C-like [Alligator sinensis]
MGSRLLTQPGMGDSSAGNAWPPGLLPGRNSGPSISDQELQHISEELYAADVNRATGRQIILDLQHKVPASETSTGHDYASHKLFRYVDEGTLFTRPTFARLRALLDNYDRQTGQKEVVTATEAEEQEAFLAEIFATPVLATLTRFFLARGLYASEAKFQEDLKTMWFGMYSRSSGKATDSSGFEHVFHGEIKKGKVSGFHNWVHYYELEKTGQINYLSYSYDGPWTTYPDILAIQYRWNPTGCECTLSLAGKRAQIQTYSWANTEYGPGQHYLASSYPFSP